MATEPDPYRTLGLTRGATLEEVRRAYRRLVKTHHPDAAGEAALPRFLAIQAAYDLIVGPGSARAAAAARRSTPRRPWEADPDRANATHRAYGGRSRRARPGTEGSRSTGSAGGPGTGTAGRASASGSSSGTGSSTSGTGRGGRRRRKATLGSTSYDDAEPEAFEPDWGGASWYGPTSGTYWTLNPKEYADPRKHGPEYQARARRAADAQRAKETDGGGDGSASMGPGPAPQTTTEAGADGASVGTAGAPSGPGQSGSAPTHTTASWWETPSSGPTPAAEATADRPGATRSSTPPPPRSRPPAAGPTMPAGNAAPSPGAFETVASWLEAETTGLPMRVGRAVLGWAPIALGIGWLAGEITGCARFAADCDAASAPLAWFAQAAILAVLLIVPRLAVIASIATLAALVAAVPAALILTATGRSSLGGVEDPVAPIAGPPILGGILVIAWAAGVGAGTIRELRRAGVIGDSGRAPATESAPPDEPDGPDRPVS